MKMPMHKRILPAAGGQATSDRTRHKIGRGKAIRTARNVFFCSLALFGIEKAVLSQDLAIASSLKDGDKNRITLANEGGKPIDAAKGDKTLPKNTKFVAIDTSQIAMATRNKTPVGGIGTAGAVSSNTVSISGEKFADVVVGNDNVRVSGYTPIGDTKKYALNINIADEMTQLSSKPSELQEIAFHVNSDQSRQMSLIFKTGVIIVFIDDSEVLKGNKNEEKVKQLVVAIGCTPGGEILQWKCGSDGSFAMKDRTPLGKTSIVGFTMTNPAKFFIFECGEGDINQMLVNGNIRVITAGNDLVVVAPDSDVEAILKYDGGKVADPVMAPDGRIIFATPENLIIEMPGGNSTTKVSWNKLITLMRENGEKIEALSGKLEHVTLHIQNNVLWVSSTSFSMTNGNRFDLQINMTTKEPVPIEIPSTTSMVTP